MREEITKMEAKKLYQKESDFVVIELKVDLKLLDQKSLFQKIQSINQIQFIMQ